MTEPDAPKTDARRPGWLDGGRAALPALAVSVLALALAAAPYVPGGPFGAQVRAYLLANPQVLDEVVAAREARQDNERVAAINAAVAANPALLTADPRDPAFGPASAKVTVIEFFDFRCPGCKAVSEDYLRLMQANPDVRFVFKDWPILDRGDDTTSNYAARAALAAHQQGKYLPVYRALMATPSLTPEAVDRVLAENGVTMPQAKAALQSVDVTRHIADIHTTAAALQLYGTPTFFINGKASPSIDPADVARGIAAAR
jgi:protein-disulfide isomerase